jgi:hypothetical protein
MGRAGPVLLRSTEPAAFVGQGADADQVVANGGSKKVEGWARLTVIRRPPGPRG